MMDDQAERTKGKKRKMGDPAERIEMNNERSRRTKVRTSRKERNEPRTTEPKGKKQKMDDLAERKETKNGRPRQNEV